MSDTKRWNAVVPKASHDNLTEVAVRYGYSSIPNLILQAILDNIEGTLTEFSDRVHEGHAHVRSWGKGGEIWDVLLHIAIPSDLYEDKISRFSQQYGITRAAMLRGLLAEKDLLERAARRLKEIEDGNRK